MASYVTSLMTVFVAPESISMWCGFPHSSISTVHASEALPLVILYMLYSPLFSSASQSSLGKWVHVCALIARFSPVRYHLSSFCHDTFSLSAPSHHSRSILTHEIGTVWASVYLHSDSISTHPEGCSLSVPAPLLPSLDYSSRACFWILTRMQGPVPPRVCFSDQVLPAIFIGLSHLWFRRPVCPASYHPMSLQSYNVQWAFEIRDKLGHAFPLHLSSVVEFEAFHLVLVSSVFQPF